MKVTFRKLREQRKNETEIDFVLLRGEHCFPRNPRGVLTIPSDG